MDLAGVIHKENYNIECAKIYGVTYLCGKQNNWRNLVSIATPVLLYLAQQKKNRGKRIEIYSVYNENSFNQ
jgi:hypothetical protein